jgi:predicted Rossmann-fold nucleotide-binding protein
MANKIKITIYGWKNNSVYPELIDTCEKISKKFASYGYHIMTGGGGCFMEAGNKGAYSFNPISTSGIRVSKLNETHLPNNMTNQYLTAYQTLMMNTFSVRKSILMASDVLIFFPGGVGTLDEFMEVINLKKKDKLYKDKFVVCVGNDFYGTHMREFFEKTHQKYPEDQINLLSEDPDEIINKVNDHFKVTTKISKFHFCPTMHSGVALALKYKNGYILGKRGDECDNGPRQYAFFGGKVDKTDSDLLETCKREIIEELGFAMDKSRINYNDSTNPMTTLDVFENVSYVTLTYEYELNDDEFSQIKNVEKEKGKCSEIILYSKDDINDIPYNNNIEKNREIDECINNSLSNENEEQILFLPTYKYLHKLDDNKTVDPSKKLNVKNFIPTNI